MRVKIRVKRNADKKYFVDSTEYLWASGLSASLEEAKEEFREELAAYLDIDQDEIELIEEA